MSSSRKSQADVQSIANCINGKLHEPPYAMYHARAREKDGWLIIPAWGFEIHLLFGASGGVISGYINDTAD